MILKNETCRALEKRKKLLGLFKKKPNSIHDTFRVAPSILAADFAQLGSEVRRVQAGGAELIHIDVMDGHFVANISVGLPVVKSLRQVTSLPLDVHLMIERPERYIKDFRQAGADMITIHVEASQEPATVLDEIRKLGCLAGITLRPKTNALEIQSLLKFADIALIMTVEPGFGGQTFLDQQIEKLSQVRCWIKEENLETLIEVDGGINPLTAAKCSVADILVAGNYIFRNPNYAEAIQNLKKSRQVTSL